MGNPVGFYTWGDKVRNARGRVAVFDDSAGGTGVRDRLATLSAPAYFGEMGLLPPVFRVRAKDAQEPRDVTSASDEEPLGEEAGARFEAFGGELLLLPHRRHGPRDRHQIGRRGEQHLALERPFPKRRIDFERGVEEVLARHVHHHQLGRIPELRPIGLGAELLRVGADRGDVRAKAGGPLVVLDDIPEDLTDLLELQESLRRTEVMSTLGALVAGSPIRDVALEQGETEIVRIGERLRPSADDSQPAVTIVSELSSTKSAVECVMPRFAVAVKPRLRSLRRIST